MTKGPLRSKKSFLQPDTSVASSKSIPIPVVTHLELRLRLDDFSQKLRNLSSDLSRLSARAAFYSGTLYLLESPKEK